MMISVRSDDAPPAPEIEGASLQPPPNPDGKDPRRPITAGLVLRRLIQLGLGLLLLWVLAVFWLGLLHRFVNPVSTLMLGRWLTLRPVERLAVDLDQIAPALPLAVMASEDARFCQHRGVDWEELQGVIEDEDGPARGASTLPMQAAKNLYLWPSRSYIRKGLELPIALYIDFIWPKRRMMENYLNIAEWGEGLFGAEAAAQRYFRKPARSLSRREAALLATALPNPILRNPGRPTARHRALAERLLARMETTEAYAGCLRGEP